jgi:CDP-glucose 4,6-dehydratase
MNIQNFFKNKKVIITGHTGFKGAWMSIMLYNLGARVYGISKDRGSAISLAKNFSSIFEREFYADIVYDDLESIFLDVKPEFIFHLAAQSLVIKGQENPLETLLVNSIGSYKVLETASKISGVKTIVCATTDKVYKNGSKNNSETSQLGGKDFYSTSKVNAEEIIKTFINTNLKKELNVSIVRSGNVIGGGERAENRLFTDLIYSAINTKKLYIRYPNALRPWQYVLDSVYGYLLIAKYSSINKKSEIFNLNSNQLSEYKVIDIINKFSELWDEKVEIELLDEKIRFEETVELRINSKKAFKELNWNPSINLDELISKIVNWEKNFLLNQSIDFSLLEVKSFLKNIDY